MAKIENTLKDVGSKSASGVMNALKVGVIAGIGRSIGSGVLGRGLGDLIGGVVAGAVTGGDDGDFIVKVVGYDVVTDMLSAAPINQGAGTL